MTPHPEFETTVAVSQLRPDRDYWLCGIVVIVVWVISVNAMTKILKSGEDSYLMMLILDLAAMIILPLLVTALGFKIFDFVRKSVTGTPIFSAVTQVRLDEKGFRVEGLGIVPWDEVLALEGPTNGKSPMLVETVRFNNLVLDQVEVLEFAPVLIYYMTLYEKAVSNSSWCEKNHSFVFRALPFRWMAFQFFINLGFLVGGTTFWLVLFASYHDGWLVPIFFSAVVGGCTAYAIWLWPFMRIKNLTRGHIKSFQCREKLLSSSDGKIQIDLGTSTIRYMLRTGIGYDFQFISIKSKEGKRLNLLMDLVGTRALMLQLRRAEVVVDFDFGGYGNAGSAYVWRADGKPFPQDRTSSNKWILKLFSD